MDADRQMASAARSPGANWAGNVTYGAAPVYRPGSADELRRMVAGSDRIRAVGSGHSFSRIADTTGDLVRLDGLPPTVEIDTAARTATVPAGMTYAAAAVILDRAGLALANLASVPQISVAGSCATGTHGSGDTQRCLAASVAALEVVGPDGDLVRWRRDTSPDFPGSVVALGALGIVTRLTLEVEPAYEVAQRVRLGVPLEEVASRLDEVFGAAYSVSAFTDWRSGEAAVWLKRRTDRPESDQPEPHWAGGRPALRPVHPVPGMPPEFATEQLGVAGPWHERLPHFRAGQIPSAGNELQSELLLPRASAGPAFAALRGLGELIAPVVHVTEVRTVRGDDLWLSPAYGRDSVTFHFTWLNDAAAVMPVLAAIEDRLMPLGARPHWAKLTTVPAPDMAALYERGSDFAALAGAFDPAGKFRNAFVDSIFPRP
jgi:alditol oxidase